MTLERVENPDKVEVIKVDRKKLPRGEYTVVGYEARQVFDMKISREATEYRAEIVEDAERNRFVAPFPEGGLFSFFGRGQDFLSRSQLPLNLSKTRGKFEIGIKDAISRLLQKPL